MTFNRCVCVGGCNVRYSNSVCIYYLHEVHPLWKSMTVRVPNTLNGKTTNWFRIASCVGCSDNRSCFCVQYLICRTDCSSTDKYLLRKITITLEQASRPLGGYFKLRSDLPDTNRGLQLLCCYCHCSSSSYCRQVSDCVVLM